MQYDSEKLTISDHLAIDRTVLANGRTFLAYVRTALAMFIIGTTFTHFLDPSWYFPIIGGFLDLLGVILLWIGTVHFVRTRRRLSRFQPALKNQSTG